MALIPSAVATWVAPWALDASDLSTTWHLARLAAVLVASVIAMVIGARLHMGGLLLPASLALAIAALAQVWSGLSNLPRWVGLAIAGTLLVLAGARIESLRREGRRAVGWLEGLD
jgi:prolipoprotein diacylglyceryltransferase